MKHSLSASTGLWWNLYHFHTSISLLGVLLALFFFEETEPEISPPYDIVGFVILLASLLSMLFVVTQVKEPWNTLGWYSSSIHWAMGSSLLFFFLFVYHSLTTKFPLFDLRLFLYRPFALGCLSMAAVSIMVFGVTMATLSLLQEAYLYERWFIGRMMSMIGIVYCIVGVVPALVSKYINFRLFIIAGIALLATSCFQAQTLTIESDKFELGYVVLMRAVGVALSLGPITVLALLPFSRETYAKGSSLITFIRQLGAVFGSGWIILISDTRQPYHIARFGEQVNIYSAKFRGYFAELSRFIQTTKGADSVNAMKQAKQLIIDNIETQAQISSILDAEYLIGWILLFTLAIVVIAMVESHWRRAISIVSSQKVMAKDIR